MSIRCISLDELNTAHESSGEGLFFTKVGDKISSFIPNPPFARC